MIEASPKKKLFFDEEGNPREVVNSRGIKRTPYSKDFEKIISTNDE